MAVYFELYGLPGAGKTTLCRPVISLLKGKGYKVADLDDVYHRNCRNGSKYPVILNMMFKVKCYSLYYRMWKVFLTCDTNDRNFSYFLKAAFLSFQIIDAMKNGDYDIVLCEEGFIQYVSSFCYSTDLPESKHLSNLCAYMSSLLRFNSVHCCLDVDVSLKRINNRPVLSRRFSSSCSSDLMRKALISKSGNLRVISSYFTNALNLDMLKDVDGNQKALLSYITGKLG